MLNVFSYFYPSSLRAHTFALFGGKADFRVCWVVSSPITTAALADEQTERNAKLYLRPTPKMSLLFKQRMGHRMGRSKECKVVQYNVKFFLKYLLLHILRGPSDFNNTGTRFIFIYSGGRRTFKYIDFDALRGCPVPDDWLV